MSAPNEAQPIDAAPDLSDVWAGTRRHAPLALAVLSALLIAAYVWWRISALYTGIDAFWARPLGASADAFRARATSWLTSRRDAGEILGTLLDSDGGRTPAFDRAASAVLASNGVEFITLRVGNQSLRCSRPPGLDTLACEPGSSRYAIPSEQHPQARRVRPGTAGRVLVPVVASVRTSGASGTVTQWIDPEAVLIPSVLSTPGSVPGASAAFVRRDADSLVIWRADADGKVSKPVRIPNAALPDLYRRMTLEGELARGADVDGTPSLGVAAYVPRLRWHVFRSTPLESAYAVFRREIATEAILAFLLGSFVIGLLVWSLRARREERMRAALVQARLDSLHAQLRPHFLFNSLNTVATLLHEDVAAAEQMLYRLADLLRLSLEESEDAVIPLHRELDLLDAFIELERVRFGAALRVSANLEPGTADLLVPRWLLQPLVENAIKHGAAYRRGEASIVISAARQGTHLEIIVADDGPRSSGGSVHDGIGLRNVRVRLQTLFGDDVSVMLRPGELGGTEVLVGLPARRSSTATQPPSTRNGRRSTVSAAK